MTAPEYWHRVEADYPGERVTRYNGRDAADAMAAWSRAVSDGAEYIVIESLIRSAPLPPEHQGHGSGQACEPPCPAYLGQ